MKNYTNELIAQIKALALTEIPAWLKEQKTVNEKDYIVKRIQLNTLVVQALTGCEIKPNKKGEYKVHFNKALPTQTQVHEIAQIMDVYVNNYESFSADDDDDMEIPHTPIAIIEKCSNKKLRGSILGSSSITNEFIDGIDCIAIAAMGEEARRRRNIMLASVIIGSTILVAGGVTVGIIFYNKKKAAKEVDGIDFDNTEFEETGDDEAPVVELEAVSAI